MKKHNIINMKAMALVRWKKGWLKMQLPFIYNAFVNKSICQISIILLISMGQEGADSSPINIF